MIISFSLHNSCSNKMCQVILTKPHMTAAINDVDDETLQSLHAMCVNEVRKINGIIDYENAVDFQQG